MLSHNLDALSAHFHEWARKGGVEMDPPVLRTLADELTRHAQDARALEAAQVPSGYRVDPACHPNVVSVDFPAHARVRDVARVLSAAFGPQHIPPVPGGAA